MRRKLGILAATVAAWWLCLAFDLGLRLFGLNTVLRWRRLQSHPPGSVSCEEPAPTRAQARDFRWLVRSVDLAARLHPVPMTCLRRSLALQALLELRGIQAIVCIGAKKEEGDFDAHAWLAWQGFTYGRSDHVPLLEISRPR